MQKLGIFEKLYRVLWREVWGIDKLAGSSLLWE